MRTALQLDGLRSRELRLTGVEVAGKRSTENERETPCYRREHNSRHRGANAFAAGADQVADILAAFRNVDGGLGGGTVTSVAPSAKRLSVSSGRRKRRNDQPQMDRDRPFENPDGSLVMQESCQGTHRECWI